MHNYIKLTVYIFVDQLEMCNIDNNLNNKWQVRTDSVNEYIMTILNSNLIAITKSNNVIVTIFTILPETTAETNNKDWKTAQQL